MDLQEIRVKINSIDDEIKRLYSKRLEYSRKVASVKLSQKDEVFKPIREKEILKRFSETEDARQYASLVKRIIQLSRKLQYSQFIEKGYIDDNFNSWIEDMKVFENGGELVLNLYSDPEGMRALTFNELLSVASDTELVIKEICSIAENGVKLTYAVPSDENSRAEAFLLAYMMFKETIKR